MNTPSILHNDEGMWLPNALPVARIKKLYDFEPTADWAEHVQKASIRMNNGGSASFVSANGLLTTNHHIAESILGDLSSPEKDYIKDGFYAATLEDEAKAPQLEVNVLWEIEDVTERVLSAVTLDMDSAKSHKAKEAEVARITNESHTKTGLRSDVVTLYQGGKYHLYRYKKYTDVRLVFAPEYAIAGLGGDVDNYEYPRYNLDVAFFRVYEDGKPLQTPHYFTWASENSKEGDFLFVSGHPGQTDRMSTLARIVHLRDHGLPYQLTLLRRSEILFQQFGNRSIENKRKAHRGLHYAQNIRKRFAGQLAALQNPSFLAKVAEKERKFRELVVASPEMTEKYGDAWDMIESAEKKLLDLRDKVNFFENGLAFGSLYFGIARTLVRMAIEDQKPNEERLPEFVDSKRDSMLQDLFSPAPIYPDLEKHKLADSLAMFAETFGFDDPLVKRVLKNKGPKERAHELVENTMLGDVDERKRLVEGGADIVSNSKDPFMLLADSIDEEARKVRKVFESEVEEVRMRAYAKIAEAMFAIYGDSVYPDATFTLRVAFGRVIGFNEGGEYTPHETTIGDVFAHADKHENKEPWELPQSWITNKEALRESPASFNFITTHDTHGGNSGSPIFDRNLHIVGLLFDGTVQGLGNTFCYTDEVSRSVSVHTAGILEVLAKVYRTDRLIKELVG